MQEQKELLEKALDKHQEGTEQRDDITVVGLRL
jgi:serine phosphatase RsbU (regulator of sigma subunit)